MPRVRPLHRFDDIVRGAARAFIEGGGFHRTQMSDIADAIGVAKGTLYLFAESKEALLSAVLEHADTRGPISPPSSLPIATTTREEASRILGARLERESRFPRLAAAMSVTAPKDARDELREIVAELYDVLYLNRVTIKLLSITAAELPEIAAIWFGGGRHRLVARLAAHLARRAEVGAIGPVRAPAVAARLILETCSFFAVDRHFDRSPQEITDEDARAETIRALGQAFAPA